MKRCYTTVGLISDNSANCGFVLKPDPDDIHDPWILEINEDLRTSIILGVLGIAVCSSDYVNRPDDHAILNVHMGANLPPHDFKAVSIEYLNC